MAAVCVLFPAVLVGSLWESERTDGSGTVGPLSMQVSVGIENDRLVLTPNVVFSEEQKVTIFHRTMDGAERGDGLMQWRAGFSYFTGYGTPPNETKAVMWWQKASEKDIKWAQFAMGWVHQHGLGGKPVDQKASLDFYRRAAASKDPYFQGVLHERLSALADMPQDANRGRKN